MSIRRALPSLLALVLLAAGCGRSDAAKAEPDDAVGMGEAEGAAAGSPTAAGQEGGQPGTPANDTTPHRPGGTQ